MDFGEILQDPKTKRTRVRNVDVTSESYQSARQYMIWLGREDFAQDEALEKYAAVTGLTTTDFHERFGYLVEDAEKA